MKHTRLQVRGGQDTQVGLGWGREGEGGAKTVTSSALIQTNMLLAPQPWPPRGLSNERMLGKGRRLRKPILETDLG